MPAALIITLGIVALLAMTAILYVLREHVLPDRATARWADHVGLRRRHLESITSWNQRLAAQSQLVTDAAIAFCAEARRLGHVETDPSGRSSKCYLPKDHPLAIQLEEARNPCDPPRPRRDPKKALDS